MQHALPHALPQTSDWRSLEANLCGRPRRNFRQLGNLDSHFLGDTQRHEWDSDATHSFSPPSAYLLLEQSLLRGAFSITPYQLQIRNLSTSYCTPGTVHASTSKSEEHTSELQSLRHLVCRLLLE